MLELFEALIFFAIVGIIVSIIMYNKLPPSTPEYKPPHHNEGLFEPFFDIEEETPHHKEGLSDEIYQDTGEGMLEK
jgi:hypothetical protein